MNLRFFFVLFYLLLLSLLFNFYDIFTLIILNIGVLRRILDFSPVFTTFTLTTFTIYRGDFVSLAKDFQLPEPPCCSFRSCQGRLTNQTPQSYHTKQPLYYPSKSFTNLNRISRDLFSTRFLLAPRICPATGATTIPHSTHLSQRHNDSS